MLPDLCEFGLMHPKLYSHKKKASLIPYHTKPVSARERALVRDWGETNKFLENECVHEAKGWRELA